RLIDTKLLLNRFGSKPDLGPHNPPPLLHPMNPVQRLNSISIIHRRLRPPMAQRCSSRPCISSAQSLSVKLVVNQKESRICLVGRISDKGKATDMTMFLFGLARSEERRVGKEVRCR